MKFPLSFSVAALVLTLGHSAPASPLSDLMAQHQMEWLVGSWSNDEAKMSYEWKLDKHAIGVKYTIGERMVEGMIMLKPGTEEAIYGAADNAGGVSQGKWVEQNEHATLKVKHTESDGTVKGMAVEHVKIDDKTIKLIIFKVSADGQPEGDGMEVEMKRQ